MSEPVDPEPGPLSAGFIALAFLGGVAGTAARYGLGRWLPTGSGFPWGTFTANLLGSFILGALLQQLSRRGADTGGRHRIRLLVGTGFCGGLTTYSTYAVETDLLFRDHRAGLALVYLLATVWAGLIVVAAGIAASDRVLRP
ncbi:MAG: fluoride efflux transporter CrcB [Frankiaceae bacterium]|nr:fluoride efflux transporter CrcB [Frankiaceae bacterium]MBV9872452.1 fluoride efflux transporter CrcB [Frankiaceae bacterium]